MWFREKRSSGVSDDAAMQQMQQVMALLDEWQAPEPSPWFDARMMARFREEQQREPEGLLARMRNRWLYNSNSALKPAMVGALAVLMVAGGGGYWQALHAHAAQPTVSAAVHDLQVMDSNDQTIQVMGQLLDDADDGPPQS